MKSNSSKSVVHSAKVNFSFRLQHLFYAISLIACGLAIAPQTIILSLMALVFWWLVFQHQDRKTACLNYWIVLILLGIFLGMFLLPAVQTVRESSRRTSCMNNIRQIVLAIHNFESANGQLPCDFVVTTPTGEMLTHSWRIQLLPYIDHNNVYAAYDLNEPWDGPQNSKLVNELTWSCFECPSNSKPGRTTYKLVVGPGTAFAPTKKTLFSDVKDGLSNTIALLEDANNPVNWMEPGTDLPPVEASKLLNGLDWKTSAHISETTFRKTVIGANLALLDGSVWCWPPNSTNRIEAGAFLIDDGTFFEASEKAKPLVVIKYHAYIAVWTYVLLLILPTYFVWRHPYVTGDSANPC